MNFLLKHVNQNFHRGIPAYSEDVLLLHLINPIARVARIFVDFNRYVLSKQVVRGRKSHY